MSTQQVGSVILNLHALKMKLLLFLINPTSPSTVVSFHHFSFYLDLQVLTYYVNKPGSIEAKIILVAKMSFSVMIRSIGH